MQTFGDAHSWSVACCLNTTLLQCDESQRPEYIYMYMCVCILQAHRMPNMLRDIEILRREFGASLFGSLNNLSYMHIVEVWSY